MNGIKLDAVAGAEFNSLMRQAEADPTSGDPANLGVVVVNFRSINFSAAGGRAEVGDDIGVFDLAEFEIAGAVIFFCGPMGEGRFTHRQQIGSTEAKGSG